MQSVTFKSPDDGSVLSFEVTYRDDYEIAFNVSVRTSLFAGTAASSTYTVMPPDDLFLRMAAEWQGWTTPKTWSDLESRVSFEAASDSTGHVKIAVKLNDQNYESHLYAVLKFEAGQLEGMANELSMLFK